MLRYDFSIAQMKIIDTRMKIGCLIVTNRALFMNMWVLKVRVEEQRASKEAEN